MNIEQYYEIWKEKNKKILENKEDFLYLIKSAYVCGYCDGIETQETKTAEYNWNEWNQK
jgi:hypothetical protein